MSQPCLLHLVGYYRVWNATASLKALQRKRVADNKGFPETQEVSPTSLIPILSLAEQTAQGSLLAPGYSACTEHAAEPDEPPVHAGSTNIFGTSPDGVVPHSLARVVSALAIYAHGTDTASDTIAAYPCAALSAADLGTWCGLTFAYILWSAHALPVQAHIGRCAQCPITT